MWSNVYMEIRRVRHHEEFMETVKVFFKSQLAYRFDVFINMIFSYRKLFWLIVLWSAVLGKKMKAGVLPFMRCYRIISLTP